MSSQICHEIVVLKALAVNVRQRPRLTAVRIKTVYTPIWDAERIDLLSIGWLRIERENQTWFMAREFADCAPRWAVSDVPWVSQLGEGASEGNDCGQACVLMLLKYAQKLPPATPVETLTRVKSGRTHSDDLRTLAARWGLVLSPEPPEHLLEENETRVPGIALVSYRALGIAAKDNPAARQDPGLHWVTVVGAWKEWVYIHDPLWMKTARGGAGGAFIPILKSTLLQAVYHKNALALKS